MQAVILAGGKGKRLAPYTNVLPKPLMPIGDRPILEVVFHQLKYYGFTEVTLAVGHLANLIQTFFGDGSRHGLHIQYSMEDEPLGTAGPLRLIDGLENDFLVMNGDILTTLDYGQLMKSHQESDCIASIAVYPRTVYINFGVIEHQDGQLVDYQEKPTLQYDVSMGIYVFSPRVLEFIPHNQYLDINVLMMNLKQAGEAIHTYKEDCYWLDIGRPDDHEQAIEEFEKRKHEFLK